MGIKSGEINRIAPSRNQRIARTAFIAFGITGLVVAAFAIARVGMGGTEPVVEWNRLTDGSLFTSTSDVNNLRYSTRCWKNGNTYDCLDVNQMQNTLFISRFEAKTPATGAVFDESGYECMVDDGIVSEFITKKFKDGDLSETVKTNQIASVNLEANANLFWTKSYVDQYMRDNQITGKTYFNCPYVLKLIDSGSYASIGTTDLTYQLMTANGDTRKFQILSDPNDPLSVVDAL